jgi:hypothetical protein
MKDPKPCYGAKGIAKTNPSDRDAKDKSSHFVGIPADPIAGMEDFATAKPLK